MNDADKQKVLAAIDEAIKNNCLNDFIFKLVEDACNDSTKDNYFTVDQILLWNFQYIGLREYSFN